MPSDFLTIRSMQTINSGNRTMMEKRDTSFISEYNGSGSTGSSFVLC
jgi:hypothetical protein